MSIHVQLQGCLGFFEGVNSLFSGCKVSCMYVAVGPYITFKPCKNDISS